MCFLGFTKSQFNHWVELALPYITYAFLVNLIVAILVCLIQVLYKQHHLRQKVVGVFATVIYAVVALAIFFGSTVNSDNHKLPTVFT